MKYSKRIAFLLVLLLLLVAAAGCQPSQNTLPSPASTSASAAEPAVTPKPSTAAIHVQDMKGHEIKLDAPAEKVVALTASDCEILYAIGAGNTLVGRGEYCDYPSGVTNVPLVQSGKETNIEQIIALKPQVVIMSSMAQTEEQVASLETAGIKVVVSDAQNIEGVYTAIQLIGAIVGKNDEAAAIINHMKKTFADIVAKAAATEKKTVYFEVSPLEYGLWAAGSGTFMDEMAAMLGLTNTFADVKGWCEISQEQVIERNPDYIVAITMYNGVSTKPVDEIMGRKGWQDIKAIKNGTVINVDTNEISRPGPRLADAITTLYNFVYKDAALKPAP